MSNRWTKEKLSDRSRRTLVEVSVAESELAALVRPADCPTSRFPWECYTGISDSKQ